MATSKALVVAAKTLLLPANVLRGVPVKVATAETVAKPSGFGKLGWKNWWPQQYEKVNPRHLPYPYTMAAKIRQFPFAFMWEHYPLLRYLFYTHIATAFIMYKFDKILHEPKAKKALGDMVYKDLDEQRAALYQHDQRHHDHHYFKHKGCHDGHPLGHGVTDVHVL